MIDQLGKRIKENYEDRWRLYFPRRTYLILRLDGKSFHSYTKNMDKPYDKYLMKVFDETSEYLLEEIEGAVFAYTQSDEISILVTDFKTKDTQAWFNNNIQKIISVTSSLCTAKFNSLTGDRLGNWLLTGGYHGNWLEATFDCRGFIIPDPVEVRNYYIWRQKDCIRNSVSLLAQAHFSHTELQGKSQVNMHDMLYTKGINWANEDPRFKNGGLTLKLASNIANTEPAPLFTSENRPLTNLIPSYGY